MTTTNSLGTFVDLKRLNRHGPISFQDGLFDLVVRERPLVLVETGTRKGVATVAMFAAMGKDAKLYSCDPIYRNGQKEAAEAIQRATGFTVPSAAWTFLGERSDSALPKIAKLAPVWNLFVHDSDHSAKVMDYEIRFAWEHLAPGGWLVCDDWNSCEHARVKHGAFADFVYEQNLSLVEMGTAAVVQKPGA